MQYYGFAMCIMTKPITIPNKTFKTRRKFTKQGLLASIRMRSRKQFDLILGVQTSRHKLSESRRNRQDRID